MFKCCAGPGKREGKRPAQRSRAGTEGTKLKLKCVVVGDGAVGKTCLLVTFRDDRFPEEYVPTTFDNYVANMRCMVHGASKYVTYDLWDTAGQEGYDEMRKMSYMDTDVFMMMFALDNRTSFANVRSAWLPELQGFADSGVASGKAKIVLVGTKSDVRDAGGPTGAMVSDHEARQLAQELGMFAYISCSAKTRENVQSVFDMVVKAQLGIHKDTDIATSKRQSLSKPSAGGGGGYSAAAAAPVPAAQPAQAHGYQWQQQQQQQQAQAATAAPTVTHGYTPSPSQSHWQPPQPQHRPTVPQWQQPAAAPQQHWQQPAPAPQQHWQQQAAAEAPGPSSYGGVKPGLPQNWERKIDPGSGKPYFTDHNTQQTYWNPPAG